MRIHLNQRGTQSTGTQSRPQQMRKHSNELVVLHQNWHEQRREEHRKQRTKQQNTSTVERASHRSQVPQTHHHQGDERSRLNLTDILNTHAASRERHRQQHRNHNN